MDVAANIQAAKDLIEGSDDVFEGKSCSQVESIRWAAANLSRSKVKKDDAPSAEAWMLLDWARSSGSNKTVFLKDMYTKLLPSSKELEQRDRFSDDGRQIHDVIDEIEAGIGD